ncbi:hypothetical protein BDZ97DRAFT_1731661 [Flammula alnicola]|nr:hypothetical protein BDZ97DRAFT_1731661 [Flammula alnicola]
MRRLRLRRECQKHHWRLHKIDCKNRMRSDTWKPIWVLERRQPSFISGESETAEQEFSRRWRDKFSVGMALWGNTPAMDVINLSDNERNNEKDFSLAFVASGDLRHVILTANSLPSNYSGHLKILLNDHTPNVVCRNVILLLILGTIPDENLAADIALHFWYSAFMPIEYKLRISAIVVKFLRSMNENGDCMGFTLGPSSSLSCASQDMASPFFQHIISPSGKMDDFQAEYDLVRGAPSRRDFRDRMYSQLRPSHRVAFQEYRRFGIILPFGAMNAHFNVPNHSLFSFSGQWLQTDFADPLESWDLKEVVSAGKAHGAQSEDIYGCLYFFLSDQLRMFARRLREFKISFTVSNLDATSLSLDIQKDKLATYGIPRSILFDRIHVSNILDANYVGVTIVLKHWAPFLSKTNTASIVGYFMNWVALQEDGRASGAGNQAIKKAMDCMIADGRVPFPSHTSMKNNNVFRDLGDFETTLFLAMGSLDIFYDNYPPFSAFLKNQGLVSILRRDNLRLRERHTIVPHRRQTPLDGAPDGLPRFTDADSWYYYTQVSSNSGFERYVEFSWA